MCGIAGEVRVDRVECPLALRDQVLTLLRHRGPDDTGWHESPGGQAHLLHRRLSIIDLSAAGHQPMEDPDRGTVVVLNGEIYNYLELDQELKRLGYVYRSHSDTETSFHAYAEWGEDCVSHLNGMFAFALWDERRRTLFCARDRFGEKPFYYHLRAFEGIRSLPAAHTLTWTEGHKKEVRPLESWSEALLDGLRSSIRLRLRSDVPVGTCLSGGLDSSTIVSLMREMHEGPISCFSVLYDDPELSERRFVDALVEHTSVDAHVTVPDGADLHETLRRIVWHNDQPSSSIGQYSQWHAMKLAAEHGVVVLLNGQGGDEIFAGYDRHVPTGVRALALRGHLPSAVRLARSFAAVREVSALVYGKQAVYPLLPASLREAWTQRARRFTPGQLAGPALEAHRGPRTELAHASLRDHLIADLTALSVPGLAHGEDRRRMAFSREMRLPFLDHRLVETILDVPQDLKLRDGESKYLLRPMKGRLAETVRKRSDKKAYSRLPRSRSGREPVSRARGRRCRPWSAPLAMPC